MTRYQQILGTACEAGVNVLDSSADTAMQKKSWADCRLGGETSF
jgi:hypothetical protein